MYGIFFKANCFYYWFRYTTIAGEMSACMPNSLATSLVVFLCFSVLMLSYSTDNAAR